ncbi:MarR family transcriptional regulator [Nocardia cyriacigeorgica]|uniref:MarR family transcriptional regulator n=2 Tax=Nocardia cyriacigeorgica TaxID=135487 RepID=A0A6P1D7L3_9NOCA|nr:MarR family transcriptional regulator [Nocardia cyriacigeorgica]NEW44823.1 MarR family transcriptional regulator [Nocardia cyriacigeorgica]NEW50431.1 MarR family transcriptional regulator [Nocardia cyriacigeorgica]NEW57975.1 MarR family transcriptional regulator [Nocardia cyriacigeorgica]
MYRPLLDELGLTYPQYLVLLVLWERGEVTVKDLGAALELDSGTLSPLLKRLESAAMVQRRRAADDERSVVVETTPEGQALRERAKSVPRRIGCATGLADTDLEEFRAQLRAITAFMDNQQLVLDDTEENS